MPTTLQLRRYDSANIANLTGAVGEVFIDMDKDTIVVQDGSTAGGFPLAREGAYTQANNARDQANTARDTANSAYGQANSARDQANTAYGQANDAYLQANTARNQANAAYAEANLKLNLAGGTISGNLVISGNLEVLGNSTTLNVETLSVEDNEIILNSNVTGAPSLNAFVTINRGTSNNVSIKWDENSGQWKWGDDDQIYYAFDSALDGYAQANNARDQANTARNTANDSYGQANAAYDAANNAQVTVYANNASGKTTQFINFANTATIQVAVSADGSNANVEFVTVGDSSAATVQGAYGQANSARDQANTARDQANAAYGDANTRVLKAGDTMTGTLSVQSHISANVFRSTNTTLSAPSLSTFDGERLRLYDFNQAGHPNYAIGVEGSHIWMGVDDIGPTLGFKWYGNTTLVGLLRTNSTFEVSNTVQGKVLKATGTGTAVDASQGNILTNEVTGTKFKYLAGLYTVTVDASGATSNYTFNLPPTGGVVGQVLETDGNGDTIWSSNVYSLANTVYEQANTARDQANTARTTANDAYGQANTARDQANTARDQANSAYAEANLKLNLTGGALTGNLNVAAWLITENIVPNTNVTYDIGSNDLRFKDIWVSNSTIHLGDAEITSVEDEVRITKLNVSTLSAASGINIAQQSTDSYGQANTARDQANTARDQANTARDTANDSYGQANTARDQANTARDTANDSYGQANTARDQANTARDQANSAYGEANLKLNLTGGSLSGSLNIVGDLSVTNGNIYLSGNTTFINVATFVVDDALIYLGGNNTISDTIDLGFVAAKNSGPETTHTGLARDASDGTWYLFDNLPDAGHQANIIDFANTNLATLRANINANSILWTGNAVATQANLTLAHDQANTARNTANDSYGQANTARDQANTARDQANAAYADANTRVLKAGDTVTGTLNVHNLLIVQNVEPNLNVTYNLGSPTKRFKDLYLSNSTLFLGETIISADGDELRANTVNVAISILNGGLNVLDQANTARDQANTARTTANDSYGQANTARDQANTARDQANSAYNAANNAQVTVYQNSASAVTTQKINFVNTSTITVAVTNESGNANIAFTAVGGAAYDQANSAYNQANSARDQANTAYGQANAAYGAANNRVLKAGDTMTGRLYINASGTVLSTDGRAMGLGTHQPTSFSGYSYYTANNELGSGISLMVNGSDGLWITTTADDTHIEDLQNRPIRFSIYSQEKMRIANSGNVGIFTSNPTSNLHVVGNANVTTGINTATINATTANIATIDPGATATQLRLRSYREGINTQTITASSVTLDLSGNNIFDLTLQAATVAITFNNAAASGNSHPITLMLRQPSATGNTVTFANTVNWSNAEVPTLASGIASRLDIITIMTVDGGTTYFGAHSMANVAY